jgi:hypothetical protein
MPIPATKERITFLSHYRYYQNTCTASYSYVWKTWKQWEEDIDWMVMSGINLPLAFTGQEIVWKKLWESYGVSEQGLQQYFTGPAFLTWQRMANIRAFAGPLSDNWISSQGIVLCSLVFVFSLIYVSPFFCTIHDFNFVRCFCLNLSLFVNFLFFFCIVFSFLLCCWFASVFLIHLLLNQLNYNQKFYHVIQN